MNGLVEVNPLKDESNPRSVINITPSSIAAPLKYIPESVFELGEEELRSNSKSGEIEEQLRISFWKEYDQAQKTGKAMNVSNIYGGVCSQTHFLKKIVTNSFKLAYILTQPKDMGIRNEELLNLAYSQVRDILLKPHVDRYGNLDARAAGEKIKLFNSLADRVQGAVIHRSETRNLNMNVDTPKSSLDQINDLNSLEAINEKIRELQSPNQVIDVTPEKETESD